MKSHISNKDPAMPHGRMVQNSAKALVAFMMLGLVGACGDNQAVAPVSQEHTVSAPANFVKTGYNITFRVNNSRGTTQKIGQHVINIPANAICDLGSGYGPTFWDKTCEPMNGSTTIKATVFVGPNGEPYIDFQPAMRFAPNKEVMLFFREGRTNGEMEASVEYCNDAGYCVDESVNDPSLKPFRVGRTSIIGRRVKHFSGYTVTYEIPCLGSILSVGDGNSICDAVEGVVGGLFRRSGYMVASGEDVRDIMNDDQDDQRGRSKEQE
jgi:hypothetical protein